MKKVNLILRSLMLFIMANGLILLLSCKQQPESLREAYHDHFLVGAAINWWTSSGRDSAQSELYLRHFNSLTPENELKWERIHPMPGQYNFRAADVVVDYGVEHGSEIIGHVLIWHSQTPGWVFEDEQGTPLDREQLLGRMKDHITTVMTRYKGKINTWDVVNEALEDDGSLRRNKWQQIIGDDWVGKAFEYAHQADPDAKLLYNDYSLANPEKREGVIRLVNALKTQGLKVDGIGMQCHYQLETPDIAEVEKSIIAFAEQDVGVHITELDINVLPAAWGEEGADVRRREQMKSELNPWPDSLPAHKQEVLTRRYEELFRVFKKHSDKIERVTFWGVSDRSSWLNNWPIRGRTNYPLLFDRHLEPKPAYHAVIGVAE